MNPFSLLIKPASADCNLQCEYCFYLDRCALYPSTNRHRMTPEILELTVRKFLGTDQSQYSFGWQGGESTLMKVNFFQKVTSLQERFCRPGSFVSNGLQTNATLIHDAFARHLAANNFLVGISLDGPEKIHDRYRKYPNKKGTHVDVLRGIACLKRYNVKFNALTLVSQANAKIPIQVYRYLRDEVGCSFHQYVECVEFDKQGNLMPYAIGGKEWGNFLCAIYDEWRNGDIRHISVRLFDSILTMMVDNAVNVCAFARDCRHYLVVEFNGDVYPCDFFVEKDLKLGNITECSWEEMLTSRKFEAFGSRKRQWHEECVSCSYLRYCAGCCPKNRIYKGRTPKTKSVLCEGWKQFFAHALPGLEQIAREIKRRRIRDSHPSETFEKARSNDTCP